MSTAATAPAPAATTRKGPPAWVGMVAPYKRSTYAKGLWQLGSTMALYLGGATAAWFALNYAWWLAVLIAIPTGGFLTRIFVLQHDCGHGSLFPSKRWNEFIGKCLGVLTFTPYEFWRKSHALHHATSGDLDNRGFGDVTTLTVSEYEALSRKEQWKYWLYRHPVVMFGIFPLLLFLVRFRFAYRTEPQFKKEYWSVYRTNFFILAIIAVCWLTIGWKAWLLIQGPIMWSAATLGVWLFYVQHQYEDSYWEKHENWDYYTASLKGSSFLTLPKPLQWLTANIGVHHVHHLCPGIPNYELQRCHNENAPLQETKYLGVVESIGTAFLALWDEDQKRLISFAEYRRSRAAAPAAA